MHYSFTGDITEILDEAFYVIEDILGSDGLAIVGSIAAIVFGVLAVLGIIGYFVRSAAVYSIAKKFGKNNAKLAWIPVFHDAFCMYVLSDVTARTTFFIHPQIDKRIENRSRRKSFSIYLIGALLVPFVGAFVSMIVTVVIGWIPVFGEAAVGLVSLAAGLLPAVIIATIRFVYLRDILDALRRDKAENQQSAIIVTAVSHFIPLVFSIYLLTLRKYEPLHPSEYCYEYGWGAPYGDPYAGPGGNPYAGGFNPNSQQGNPYGAPTGNPYESQQGNPYGAPAGNPYDSQQGNPYGTQNNNPYGTPSGNTYESQNNNPYSAGNTPYGGGNNPYTNGNTSSYADGNTNPYADSNSNPYANGNTNPYASGNTNPYANGNTNPYADGNTNPYANGNTNPYAGGNTNPYSAGNQNPYSAPGSGAYGTPGNPPYGTPFTPPPAPEAQSSQPPEPETPPEAPQSV